MTFRGRCLRGVTLTFSEEKHKLLTSNAMLGRMSRSSSRRPSLSSGTQTRGWRGTALMVPLSLKETLEWTKSSLEKMELDFWISGFEFCKITCCCTCGLWVRLDFYPNKIVFTTVTCSSSPKTWWRHIFLVAFLSFYHLLFDVYSWTFFVFLRFYALRIFFALFCCLKILKILKTQRLKCSKDCKDSSGIP